MSLAEVLERHRHAGVFSHAYAAYGRLAERDPRMVARVGPDARSIFDLASLTKALVTVPLIFEQDLPFDGTVFDWAPTLQGVLNSDLGRLRIDRLLRHEAGLPAWRNFWVCHLDEFSSAAGEYDSLKRFELILGVLNRVDAIATTRQLYSDVGFILLGLVLEARHSSDLKRLFAKLDSEMDFSPASHLDCVPSAFCPTRRRLLVGEPHDENCAALGSIAGHCGLFGTGDALCHFLHDYFFLNPIGQRILAAQSQNVRILPSADPTQDSLFGWRQGSGDVTAVFGGGRAIGHPGFTGTAFWIDPARHDYVVLLTNRVLFGRTDLKRIANVRREIYQECLTLR